MISPFILNVDLGLITVGAGVALPLWRGRQACHPISKKKAGVSCEPALGPLNTTNVAIYILIEPMITAVMATMVVIVQ